MKHPDVSGKRTTEQNSKLHPILRDLSEQVQWAGQWLTEEQWKRLVLGAAHGQLVLPDPFNEGGLVVVNKTTSSRLPKPEMSDLIDQLYAFGNERSVKWSEHE